MVSIDTFLSVVVKWKLWLSRYLSHGAKRSFWHYERPTLRSSIGRRQLFNAGTLILLEVGARTPTPLSSMPCVCPLYWEMKQRLSLDKRQHTNFSSATIRKSCMAKLP